MKVVFTGLLVLLALTRGWAQGDYFKFTDYNMAQPIINPAAIGQDLGVAGVLLYQSCFEATEFRPTTGAFNINSAIKDKGLGGGISLIYDKFGPYEKVTAYVQGSYRLKVNEGKYLYFGLQVGLNYVTNDPSKYKIKDEEPMLMQQIKLSQPNVGFGLHYTAEKYYVGISLPELMYNYVDREGEKQSGMIADKLRLFVYGGFKFDLSQNVKLEPYSYITYSESDNMEVDLGARLWYKDLFNFGVQYRTKESASVMARVRLLDELWLGYAYENNSESASDFNKRQEIGITFRFGKKGTKKSENQSKDDPYEENINSIRYF